MRVRALVIEYEKDDKLLIIIFKKGRKIMQGGYRISNHEGKWNVEHKLKIGRRCIDRKGRSGKWYPDSPDIFKEDIVYIVGLPLGMGSFENISGGYTNNSSDFRKLYRKNRIIEISNKRSLITVRAKKYLCWIYWGLM